MPKSITLTESQKLQLEKHAQKFNPNESCALLFGKEDSSNISVDEIFFTDNIEESPTNFTISNEELLKGYKLAEEKNLQMVGVFHSHPHSQAVPSETDKKFMLSNPVVWVIYSGVSSEFKAYILDKEILEIRVEFL